MAGLGPLTDTGDGSELGWLGDGVTGTGMPPVAFIGAPQLLQKPMPAGFAVPQVGQFEGNPDPLSAGLTPESPVCSKRCPQSWQNAAPSRFTRPHWMQRIMLFDQREF